MSAAAESIGEFLRFGGRVIGRGLFGGIARHYDETIRQAGLFITGSMFVVLILVFALGLQCGVQAIYATAQIGLSSVVGAVTAICNLRELTPYAFGYMMAARVGTAMAAELGAMRISDEIDALDVMGFSSIVFICSSRFFGIMLMTPFIYIIAVATGYVGSYLAVLLQGGVVSPAAYLQLFWTFQTPADIVFSLCKGMLMAAVVVLVGCYYGWNASGGPVGVGRATAKSMAVNILAVNLIGVILTQIFWGTSPRLPVGG